MPKKDKQSKFLDAARAEELFSRVDETGHDNADVARKQRLRRKEKGAGVDVDPLSDKDPSGSTVEDTIKRTVMVFVTVVLAVIVVSQVSCGMLRRFVSSNLSDRVNVTSVSMALRNGVSWGEGFTQFPELFSVQEADENTGRIEVTVTDTSSKNAVECLYSSQIQATALSVNALLNPNINVVVYHVNVHTDDAGNFQTSQFFGFIVPNGQIKNFMTFIWTKTPSGWVCSITGLDEQTTADIRDRLQTAGAGLLDPSKSTTAEEPVSGTGTAATDAKAAATDAATASATDAEAATTADAATTSN